MALFSLNNNTTRQSPYYTRSHFQRASVTDDKSRRHRREGTHQQSSCGAKTTSQEEAGLEARNFYESIISAESLTAGAPCANNQSTITINNQVGEQHQFNKTKMSSLSTATTTTTRHNRRSTCAKKQSLDAFLHSAQDGDVKNVRLMLEEGAVDKNGVDQFGWTALMCASYNGQSDVVKLLLRTGSLWVSYRDKKGYNALDLAERAGRLDIVGMLRDQNNASQFIKTESKQTNLPKRKLVCSTCKAEFAEDDRSEHQSSTVHLFNCRHQPRGTLYYIPESNVGYQMMVRDGWDKEKGLGPDGIGLKFPVKTVLKRDRRGLGAADGKDAARPKITHFKSFDVCAVKKVPLVREKKMRASTLDKVSKKKRKTVEQKWERDFRQSFNLDL